jgi:predicted transcriptional regulator
MISHNKKNRYKILKVLSRTNLDFDYLYWYLDFHPLSLRGYLKDLRHYKDIKVYENEKPKEYELTEKGEKKLKYYEKKFDAKKWWTPPWEKGLFWDRR